METIQLSALFWEIGQWSGIAAFVALSLLIFSGDTARFWDRFFGLDRIIKFQRKFSLWTALFVLLHPAFFMLSRQNFLAYAVPDFSVPPLALGIVAFYVFALVMLASLLYKRISHLAWQYIHVVTYLLFALSLIHAWQWGSDSGSWWLQGIYIVALAAVIFGAIYRTQYKIRQLFGGKFFVKSLTRETADTFTLTISQEEPLQFRAGQFCFLRLPKDSLHARHPFTIASAPAEQDLRFTIKNAGRFTDSAGKLKKGEKVLIDGPFGRFYLRDGKKPLVFIAGGVGITPFISMLREQIAADNLHNRQPSARDITLLYGSRSYQDIIFREELDSIKAPWLKKIYLLSETKAPKGKKQTTAKLPKDCLPGYIDEKIIRRFVPDPAAALFYICGPEALKNSVKKILRQLKVPRSAIFVEDFFW